MAKRDKCKSGSALLAMDESGDDEELYAAEFTKEEVADGRKEREASWSEQQKAEEALEVRGGKSSGKGDGFCFKCGGPHYQRDCPQLRQEAKVTEEAAEIVFTAVEIQSAEKEEEAKFGACGKGNVSLGHYGIIDSGATASLGSVDAMEAWREANVASCGQSLMKLDLQEAGVQIWQWPEEDVHEHCSPSKFMYMTPLNSRCWCHVKPSNPLEPLLTFKTIRPLTPR